MNFEKHTDLIGYHAFLGPSKYHWVHYDSAKLEATFRNQLAVQRGTELHAIAANCIRHGIKVQKSQKTFNRYVNDGIGFKMRVEQPLVYSMNAFGTADAISFKDNILRIHDLKTGVSPASMIQLQIYAALFCLEYGYKPSEIEIELRIYQTNEVLVQQSSPEDIEFIMDKIVVFDKQIEKLKREEEL
jgi:hypothetical protein